MALAIWDSSEWEKPETDDNEDLCAVRSSKGQRLTHIKPGYFTPPGRPIFVPGLHWIEVVLVGLWAQAGLPKLALMHYWSSRGLHASFKQDEEGKVLQQLRFVLRFKGKNHLLDAAGNRRNCWRIPKGSRGWEERIVWDSRRASDQCMPVCWLCRCTIPSIPMPRVFLVVCRSKGRQPWYLLTNEPINSSQDAWRIVFCYSRRWQSEQTWRYDKSELALTSVRASGVGTCASSCSPWQRWPMPFSCTCFCRAMDLYAVFLLRHQCHRTGLRLRGIKALLYRLRSALSRLWQQHPPNWWALAQSRPTGPTWLGG